MQCSMSECYWNMWNPNSKMFSGEDSKVCAGEDLSRHYDSNDPHKMKPNSNQCPSYWSFMDACGCKKGESH